MIPNVPIEVTVIIYTLIHRLAGRVEGILPVFCLLCFSWINQPETRLENVFVKHLVITKIVLFNV